MPEISRFKGLVIYMYRGDHGVAHFHVKYAEYEASIEVESEQVHGDLPRRVRASALVWARQHRAELLENWRRAHSEEPLHRIAPLG